MESPQYYAPPQIMDSSSRPSLGFPLGTALLLLVIFSLSGVFSCCYHWEKIRSLRRRALADIEAGDDDPSSLKHKHTHVNEQQSQSKSMPAVLMPGDEVPKFIAIPCPCQPPIPEKVVVQDPKPLPPPPKPVRMLVGLPLY